MFFFIADVVYSIDNILQNCSVNPIEQSKIDDNVFFTPIHKGKYINLQMRDPLAFLQNDKSFTYIEQVLNVSCQNSRWWTFHFCSLCFIIVFPISSLALIPFATLVRFVSLVTLIPSESNNIFLLLPLFSCW